MLTLKSYDQSLVENLNEEDDLDIVLHNWK